MMILKRVFQYFSGNWKEDWYFNGSTNEYVPITTREVRNAKLCSLRNIAYRLAPSILLLCLGIIIGINFPAYLSIYSRRPSIAPAILPRALPPPPLSLQPPSSDLPYPESPIPNVVHYVYGLAPGPQTDFPYFAYLAMRSAMMVLKPERILFHCLTEPRGYWWDRVRNWEGWIDEDGERKGIVEVLKARDVLFIGKDRRPVVHFAHKADIIRLEVLLEHGGIYLDIDTFILRSFSDASLLLHDTVMGMEANQLTFLRPPMSDDEMQPKGLCNAVIIARKGAVFLQRWLSSYDGFRESLWSEHSVEMPWTLARLYPTTITILSERTFFWPLWSGDHISAVYEGNEYDFERSGQLAYHAWETRARHHLSMLDPSTIKKIDTSFTRMARRFREPDEEARWKATGQKEGSKTGLGVGEDEEGRDRTGIARPSWRRILFGTRGPLER